jgi:hypothetical protein
VGLWEERAARNEVLFRYVNERIEELSGGAGDGVGEFVCECSNADCVARIKVPLMVYEETRANPRLFLLVPGHERPDVEAVRIVEDDYAVVEKQDVAGAIAERADPR